METLLVEVGADLVSAAQSFDLTESAANVTAVLDQDGLAESRTRGEVKVSDRLDLGSVKHVVYVWSVFQTKDKVIHRGLVFSGRGDAIFVLSRGRGEAGGTLFSDIGDAF